MKDKKLLSDIKEYLKCYENQVLEDWYELIRHISVSETGEGIETCCDWIQKKMEEIGIQVTKYSVKPAPVLVGRFGNDPEKKDSSDLCPLRCETGWRTKIVAFRSVCSYST